MVGGGLEVEQGERGGGRGRGRGGDRGGDGVRGVGFLFFLAVAAAPRLPAGKEREKKINPQFSSARDVFIAPVRRMVTARLQNTRNIYAQICQDTAGFVTWERGRRHAGRDAAMETAEGAVACPPRTGGVRVGRALAPAQHERTRPGDSDDGRRRIANLTVTAARFAAKRSLFGSWYPSCFVRGLLIFIDWVKRRWLWSTV